MYNEWDRAPCTPKLASHRRIAPTAHASPWNKERGGRGCAVTGWRFVSERRQVTLGGGGMGVGVGYR
jgi:hypothetical protein